MVISVTNISESSVNDLFHEAEIFTLNICHEMEMYNARCEFLNEAESEQKKDSAFKKFVETIKQKAIELFNKAYHAIQSAYNNFYAKKNKKAAEKVLPKDVAMHLYTKVTKEDLVLYDTLNMKVDIDQTDLNSVQDFMNSFKINKSASKDEIKKAIQGSTNNASSAKLLNDEKKGFLEDIDKQYKDGSISIEEKTTKIKRLMNRYTAELKCQVHNNKAYISVINEMIKKGTNEPHLVFINQENGNNIDQSKEDLFEDFEKMVENKVYTKVLHKIAESLRFDTSGKMADYMVKYAEERLPDLFTISVNKEDIKNNVWETDKSKWDKRYMAAQILEFLSGCGTKEQLNHLKEVAKYVYKNKS